MATPSPSQALKVKGRLCWNPTDLSTAYPHGGTALGLIRGSALSVRQNAHVVRAEEFGGAAVVAAYMGEEYILRAVLSGWDSDAIEETSLDASTGATTGRAVLQSKVSTDGVRAGAKANDIAGILYFSPDSKMHPGVLFHKALPMREETADWALRLSEEWGVPSVWLAVPDDDGVVVSVGLREDLSL